MKKNHKDTKDTKSRIFLCVLCVFVVILILFMSAHQAQHASPQNPQEGPASTIMNRPFYPPAVIEDYRPVLEKCGQEGLEMFLTIRRFSSAGQEYLLVVNPRTFQTEIVEDAGYTCQMARLEDLSDTPFVKELIALTATPSPLLDAGLRHAVNRLRYPILTVDLCPSHRPFEKQLFEKLIESRLSKPVPVAICVSGLWMEHFPSDLEWLIQEAQSGHLDITWVNHTFHHQYRIGTPLEHNFVLLPGVDFNGEVLFQEKAMIARGIMPSVFFRFPGLVSNQQDILKLRDLFLLPLGSDAWLAKGERANPGSIILIHGNGNEPIGVKLFLNLLNSSLPALESLPHAVSLTSG